MPSKLAVLTDNFSTLKVKNIRIYMTGQLVNLLGDWMQQTAQAWIVWELTHKATALGIVAFLSQIPFFIFSPWAGVFADRFDKKNILLITQVLTMAFAFIMALLIQKNVLLLWHIYVLAFLLGTATAFNVTAEQTFIGELAGPGNIKKAIALNNSLNQLTRLAGPAIAGWAMASTTAAVLFWANGVSVIVSIICIAIIPSRRPDKAEPEGGLKQFQEGLNFLKRQKLLRLIILFAAIQTFFGMSLVQLLPAFSSIVLKGSADTLGNLIGAAGAGSLVGILVILPFIQRVKRSCVVIGGGVIWAGAWYILISFTHNQPLAILCQFMASLGAANVLTLSVGLAQELTPKNMRARIVSTFMMTILGLQPFASFLVGKSADLIGISKMMRINGVFMIVLSTLLLAVPRIYKLKTSISIPAVRNQVIS